MRKLLVLLPVILVIAVFAYFAEWGSSRILGSSLAEQQDASGTNMPGTGSGSLAATSGPDGASAINNPQSSNGISAAPSAEKKPQTALVVIDAGHGGSDPGTSDNGVVEKNITLDVAKKLNDILKKAGTNTYMIRTGDTFMNHKERIAAANNMNAALYISIHCDWFKDSSYSGTATLYMPSRSLVKGGLTELDYAKIVQAELINAIKIKNRGVIDRSDLAVLRLAQMPSVLVELGFLSNHGDASLLASESFRLKAAQGLAEGVIKSLQKIPAP